MKRKNFFRVIFFVGVLIFLLLAIFISDRFRIKTAVVISQQTNIYGLELMNEQNLLMINIDQVRQNLMKQNPALSSVSVVKEYPSKVIIGLQFRNPVAQIIKNSIKFYIDRNGVFLLGRELDQFLPVIDAPNIYISLNQGADWRIMKAVALLEDIAKQSISVERIYIDDKLKDFQVYLSYGGKITLPYSTDTAKVAASLQMIISRFRIEGKFIKEIDFRFDKPVVIVSNGEKISSSL